MIGIDIVDLTDPLLKHRTKDQLRFIMADGEESENEFNENVSYWILWAAKESVYKAKRLTTRFDPREIKIDLDTNNLSFSSQNTNGYLIVKEQYVLAVCTQLDIDAIKYKIHNVVSENQSNEIRKLIKKDFSKKGLKASILNGDLGLPFVKIEGQKNITLLSITHHNSKAAYAWIESLN